jgi:hypothetical protein
MAKVRLYRCPPAWATLPGDAVPARPEGAAPWERAGA